MPDDLYWQDTYAWSQEQARLLRRVAAGERVNDLDWEHVIEEVEDVGKSELRACTSLLRKALEHLLKLHGWPSHPAAAHWRGEVRGFLRDATPAYSPSMRQLISVPDLYRAAREDVAADTMDGAPPRALPSRCPLTLDDLLADPPDVAALLGMLAAGED